MLPQDVVILRHPPTVKLNSTGWVVAKGHFYLEAPPTATEGATWTRLFDRAIRTTSLDEATHWVTLLDTPARVKHLTRSDNMAKATVVEMKDPKAAERNEELGKALDEFARLAREGHLSDFALIGKVRGTPVTEFEWESDNPLELLGALELAKIEIASELLGEVDGAGEEDD
jgi:hypothetical protein